MSTSFSISSAFRHSLALAVVAGSSLAIAGAQTAPAALNGTTVAPVNFQTPLFPSVTDDASSSSSSSNVPDAASNAATTNLASIEKGINLPGVNAQYGRRRYGAPRYRGSNTNADGSEKYEVYAGAGFGIPVGTNSSYLSTGYGIQVGGGRNFNKHLGLNLEFDYDHFGLTGDAVDYYAGIYGDPTNTSGFGGNSHIWNFSIQPVYQIYSGEGLGAYITAGVGFYHKVANFTYPETGLDCIGYYCGDITENVNIDHYTSNAPGFDGGIGLTYKFSKFANQRLYAEVRYVYIDNQFKPGLDATNATTYTGNNLFPENSNTTSYIPVKFGLRF